MINIVTIRTVLITDHLNIYLSIISTSWLSHHLKEKEVASARLFPLYLVFLLMLHATALSPSAAVTLHNSLRPGLKKGLSYLILSAFKKMMTSAISTRLPDAVSVSG